jgi:hypothetical protein
MKSNTVTSVRTVAAQAWKPVLLATLLLSFAVVPTTAQAQPGSATVQARFNEHPSVLPPQLDPFGKSYGEWGAEWWQWALAQPAAINPLLDSTGEFASVGQSGPVWFLAGTFGGAAERTCTVPVGKALFFPIVNTVLGAGVWDCEPTAPGVVCDVRTLKAKAKANIDKVTLHQVEVDGVPLQNYRAASPRPFSITIPDGNVLGLAPGTYAPQVCDGYWLMLAPLRPGHHTVHFKAEGYASVDVIYHLMVADNPGVIEPECPVFGDFYGEWGAAWWQWVLGQPAAKNPLLDPDGGFASVGQAGPVWFLAGSWLNTGDPDYLPIPTVRNCVVPADKLLFFPVVNNVLGAGAFDCNPTSKLLDPPQDIKCKVPDLQAAAKASMDKVTLLEVEVDGVSLQDLFSYRAASPRAFSLNYPKNNVLGLDAGRYAPQVCDGYWLMLAPLRHGKHTIHLRGKRMALWRRTLLTISPCAEKRKSGRSWNGQAGRGARSAPVNQPARCRSSTSGRLSRSVAVAYERPVSPCRRSQPFAIAPASGTAVSNFTATARPAPPTPLKPR